MLRSRILTGSQSRSLVSLWTSSGGFKSVQSGSINMTVTPNTATITSVDINNSILIYTGTEGQPAAANDGSISCVRITLTNATTVTGVSGILQSGLIVKFSVIEFYPGLIKSIQYGTVGGGGTATITSVDTTKSTVMYLGHSTSDAANPAGQTTVASLVLTNATTVTVGGGGGGGTTSFTVVEFN